MGDCWGKVLLFAYLWQRVIQELISLLHIVADQLVPLLLQLRSSCCTILSPCIMEGMLPTSAMAPVKLLHTHVSRSTALPGLLCRGKDSNHA